MAEDLGLNPAPAAPVAPDAVLPPASHRCVEPDCGEEFPNAGLLASHRSKKHGVKPSSAKRTRKRAATPDRDVKIDRPGATRTAGAAPKADAAGPDRALAASRERQEQAARAQRRPSRVNEVHRFILGEGNDWLLEGGCWFIGLPRAQVENAVLAMPDGTTLVLRDQLTLTERQAKFLAEGYVRVEESSIGERLAELAERVAPWALIAGGVGVIGVHLFKLNQMRLMFAQIAAAANAAKAAADGASSNGKGPNLTDFLTPENLAAAAEAFANMKPPAPAAGGATKPPAEPKGGEHAA